MYDPSPAEFTDSLFRAMGQMMAEIDARADARAAAKAERRRKQAKASRERTVSRAAYEFPAAAKKTADGRWCRRVDFDGGFHVEPRSEAYRPYVGDLLRITYMTATGVITATRQPAPGRPEAPRKVTPHGAIRLLREMVASLEENMAPISYGPEGCQCAYIATPPCSYCESLVQCEKCEFENFLPEWGMDAHLDAEHPLAATKEARP